MRSARVFISCGQRDRREKETGLAVEQHFRDRGFETFLAERVHSPEALTEVIFRGLSESEYFVFIDFKREVLDKKQRLWGPRWLWWHFGRGRREEYRGSLFVSQELAIATYLKLPLLGFSEKGLKREGIAGFQLYGAIAFEDGQQILSVLEQETADWDRSSVNELAIEYVPETTTRGIELRNWPENPPSDWYHLQVMNRNKRENALSCFGYLSAIHDLESGREYDLPTIELNWAGIGDVVANVIAGQRRDLDAFFVVHGHESVYFHERALGTTNPRYHLPLLPRGRYDLEYTVVSANFATVRKRYVLEFHGTPESVRFEEALGKGV